MVLGEALSARPGLGLAPRLFPSGPGAEGAAVAVRGKALSGWRAGGGGVQPEEEGEPFRRLKASAGRCHRLCLPPLPPQPHPESVRWARVLHLLEATAKTKKE